MSAGTSRRSAACLNNLANQATCTLSFFSCGIPIIVDPVCSAFFDDLWIDCVIKDRKMIAGRSAKVEELCAVEIEMTESSGPGLGKILFFKPSDHALQRPGEILKRGRDLTRLFVFSLKSDGLSQSFWRS